MPKIVLIVYVWPEPKSSAAGMRNWNLIEAFTQAGFELVVASPSQMSSYAQQIEMTGVRIAGINSNDSTFDSWICNEQPDFVIFDRFLIEEQFGWRVQENCPNAVRILDTQDLHFLRKTRQKALQEGKTIEEIKICEFNLLSEDTLREIASLYRCDGILVLSDFEFKLLIERFNFPRELVLLSRFHYKKLLEPAPFLKRKNFVMIGNFRHPPNRDATLWFSKEIWPQIRSHLPEAEVDIYGAYPPKEMMNLTSKKNGFFVKGPIFDQFKMLSQYRVNLAPLRFGAGIKGKITDGWWTGTPVVSTSIGAEGLHDEYPFGGLISDHPQGFAESALELYQNEASWNQCQSNGLKIMKSLYDDETNSSNLTNFLNKLKNELEFSRNKNWISKILSYHSYRSSVYFSKWIEEKTKSKNLESLGNDKGLN